MSAIVQPVRGLPPPGRSWLRFRVAGGVYALDTRRLRQVVPEPSLMPLPLAADLCPGLFAWQGRPLPVGDLGACLAGRPSVRLPRWRLLVWAVDDEAGAWAVDAVDELLELGPLDVTRHWAPALPGLPAPWNAIDGMLLGAGSPGWPQEPIVVWNGPRLWNVCLRRMAGARSEASWA